MPLQVFRDCLGVGAVLLHPEGKALQAQIQDIGHLGRLDTAEVPHQLGGTLGDERTAQSKALGIGYAVVAVIRGCQAGEFLCMGGPVEFAAVHDAAAYGGGVAVHVLGGGVGHDVRPPFKGTAVDGGGEGVVHNQGNPVGVGGPGEFFDIQHRQGGVGDGLAKYGLGAGAEGGVQLFFRAVGIDKGGLQTHFLHGHGEQVEAASVNCGTCHDVVAAAGDIKDCHKVGGLAGAGQHGGGAAFQSADLGRHRVTGGVGQPGIEIALGLQIEQLAHILGGGIFECRALNDGDLPGLSVAGSVACLNAQGFGA